MAGQDGTRSSSFGSSPSFNDPNLPHPLRPYYVSPPLDSDFTFSPSPSMPSATPKAGTVRGAPSTSAPWKSAGSNRQGGISGYGSPDLDLSLLDDQLDSDVSTSIRSFASAVVLGFTSTAMVMPFEVGKTLLQVQWVPRDEGWVEDVSEAGDLGEGAGAGYDDRVPEEELDDDAGSSYFTDLQKRPLSSAFPVPSVQTAPPRQRDASGYIVRRSIFDESTKPEYTLPVVVTGGVWDMIKAEIRSKEGFFGLWKGQVTTFILDSLGTSIQPVILSLLQPLLPASSLPSLPINHSPRPLPLLFVTTFSHTLTGLLLSPLDLVRTRLIVQSSLPSHRKYTGPFDGILQTLVEDAGGSLVSLWWRPENWIPAVLDCTLRPLVHFSVPLIIERFLGFEAADNPVIYGLAELGLNTLGLCVTLPFETVRRRLQVQQRRSGSSTHMVTANSAGIGKPFKTCVEVRPYPYTGVVEAMYRILTEETGKPPVRRRGRDARNVKDDDQKPGVTTSGIRQLYRGFGMGFGANVVMFVLSIVAGRDSRESGWAEM